MATRFIARGEFKITFRADCLTEGKYVGPRRVTREKAEADAARHLSLPGNEDHRVEIEVKQQPGRNSNRSTDKSDSNHQKIVPHLWFDKEATEAVNFYVSLFPYSKMTGKTVISGTPSGDVDILTFELWGNSFMAISAGPLFKINQSISLHVYCGSDEEIERIYRALSEGGTVIFPLNSYPWCRKYAWVQDKFGMTWQLDVDPVNSPQKIVPSLLFVNEKAEWVLPAMEYYTSIFPNSKILMQAPHDPSSGLPEGSLLFAQYKINGYLVNSMSGPGKHEFDFNEAVSLMVYCETQEEIDYYWEKLTDGGQEQPCGWVKDRFGVSWQVVPVEMDGMMQTADKAQLERVMETMMPMMKLDLAELRKAYHNL